MKQNYPVVQDVLQLMGIVAAGTGLLLVIRFISRGVVWEGPFNPALEELGKLLVFASMYVCVKKGKRIQKRPASFKLQMIFLPFFAVCLFALEENILYFLSFPSTLIYSRILTSFLLHVNTGLALLMVFAAEKPRLLFIIFPASILYHWLFNILGKSDLNYTIPALLLAAAVQTLIFVILLALLLKKIIPMRLLK